MKKITDIDIVNMESTSSLEVRTPVLYTCLKCKDSGYLFNDEGAYPCPCRQKAISGYRLNRSGLSPLLQGHTFDNFKLSYYEEYLHMESRSYRQLAAKAKTACNKFAVNIIDKRPARSILLEGGVGRGKTHLAAATVNKLLSRGINVLFLIVPEFLDSIRASYNEVGEFSEAEIMHRAQEAEVLILDDLGAHNFSEWTKNKLFTLINHRVNHGRPCLITTNLSIDELNETIGERTVSRIVEICDFYPLVSDNDVRLLINKSLG